MLNVDEMIKNAMREKNTELLNVLKLIKAEFLKKMTEPNRSTKELTEKEQVKILLKMASQREESIRQYVDGGRQDLADAEKAELDIINSYIPESAIGPSDEELGEYVRGVISAYVLTKDEGYALSMRDMKPIMDIVKEKYPEANGKVISQTLNSLIVKK